MSESKKGLKKDFLWNLIAEGISAGQSALILVFISAGMAITDAGIFSIGYAISTIACVIGMYGVRNYQVTDVNNRYRFKSYLVTRFITVFLSIAVVCLYLVYQLTTSNYVLSKAIAVILICIWKLDSVFEDVVYGMYQQRGYLALGARTYALRLMASTLLFCVLTLTGLDLNFILIIVCIFSYVATLVSFKLTYHYVKNAGNEIIDSNAVDNSTVVDTINSNIKEETEVVNKNTVYSVFDGVKQILIQCLPLAISGALGNYIGNAPKYSIDWFMDDNAQAIFGYILMPSFVILILSNSVYRPILPSLSELYNKKDSKAFGRRLCKQLLMVGAMGLVILAGGFLLGIPVLSLLYSTDLTPYKMQFMLLLLGGIGYALATFASAILTVMRKQNTIAICYAICAGICFLSSKSLINMAGFTGAVIQYDICNILLSVILFTVIIYSIKNPKSE
jgi:O-antigen/teichoic acid export membrane protein